MAGRADVRRNAGAVVLNVTVTNAAAPGFVTVYPCDEGRPLAAQLNFPARTDVATAVTAKVAGDGTVCFFAPVDTDLVVDVNGFYPAGASFTSTRPARLLETRTDPGLATVDGAFLGGGAREAGSTLALRVAGRGGVPEDATEAVLDVTVTGPAADGFVTVHPCSGERPLASNVNYRRGATVTNAIVAPIGPDGTVCLFTLAPADLVVDVVAHVPARSPLVSLVPARLVDTRTEPGITTVDGQQAQLGVRGAQTATAVVVVGRAGVPTGARAAVLNLTATGAAQQGFVTAYPCTGLRPNASNLNVAAGATVANLVVAPIGTDGRVCLFTSSAMHLVVDVASWLP